MICGKRILAATTPGMLAGQQETRECKHRWAVDYLTCLV